MCIATTPDLRSASAFDCISLFAHAFKVAFRKGTARRTDHAQLVHEMWLQLALLEIDVHVVRVASKDNIADLPSRGDYGMFDQIGAVWCAPSLDTVFMAADTWEVLQERWAALEH